MELLKFPRNRQKRHFKLDISRSCVVILFLCLAVHSGSYSQELLFKKTELKKIDSVLEIYKTKDKYKYLNLLPSVNYDLLNNSFNVGFSLNGLSNYYQNKRRNKIELKKLETTLKANLSEEIQRKKEKTEAFKIELEILKNEINLFKIDFDLFQISKGKYKANEITTEEFLKLKKAYFSKKNSLKTKYLRQKIKLQNILFEKENLTKDLNQIFKYLDNYHT